VGANRGLQAGLFSAVTSAFIIEVHSHLQPDPNDETAALLRVLIHKIDNTTFGNNPPTLPQWTGPPDTIVHVQAILFASLAASLLSAFLAMLGKQWVNRYASTNMRGTAIERSQDRQRKLDGIVAWYFDHVMESLPLMLQIALLLLGCALTRYLWNINITIASVILGITSFGVIFYLGFVVAGSASESCPYQTPGSRFLRHVLPTILRTLRSAPSTIFHISSSFIRASVFRRRIIRWSSNCRDNWDEVESTWDFVLYILVFFINVLAATLFFLPVSLVKDTYQLGRSILQRSAAFCRTVYRRLTGSSPQIHALDLRCVSWMLQTSLDKSIRLSTLKHLELLMSTPADFDPALVTYCFNVFVGCINVSDCQVVVMQGFGELATASALCFFHTISHLSIVHPALRVLEDIQQRYAKVFPANIDFHGHEFSHAMNAIHSVFIRSADRQHFTWDDYKPPSDEHAIVAQALSKLARFGYQRTQKTKAPRLTLRFALHSLSLDPPPSTSIVADCLSIIAIDLGCDVSNTGAATVDERCVCASQITITLTLNQRTSRAGLEPDNSGAQNNG